MDYLAAGGVLLYSWVLFVLFGWSESLHWFYMVKSKTKRPVTYEHSLWAAMRIIFHIPAIVILAMYWSWFTILGVVGLIAMSFFMHDGMYYTMRNKWDGVYPLKWKAYSLTSTAKMTFDWEFRRNVFIWGLIFYCFMFMSKVPV